MLEREQTKPFVKKNSYRLFPKIFWGAILAVVILCLYWLRMHSLNECKIIYYVKFFHTAIRIRGIHLIGPLFGIFAGLAVGASSRPFTFKKLSFCIVASFIGGLLLSIDLYFSEKTNYIPAPDTFGLVIYSLILVPLAIGIADRSSFKILIGYIGGAIGYFLYWGLIILVVALCLGDLLPCGSSPRANFLGTFASVVGMIIIIIGIELSEILEGTKFEEIFKNNKWKE